MNKTLLIVFFFLLSVSAFSQQGATKWNAHIETQKVFIENKGQFDALNVPGKVLYGTDGHTGVFLFTKTGLSYRVEKRERKDHDAKENIKNDNEEDQNIALVNMQWEGANPDVQVTAIDELNSYFNFGMGKKSINNARTFKKIVYKNLYPDIDVEYVFHPISGIEYSLILHPGADISMVKMRYTGAEKLSLSGKGEIHIPTVFGDIIDHAPAAFYADNKEKTINSSFTFENGTAGFTLGNYDNSQTVIIDPWTTTPALPSGNVAYYIKSDSIGDAYVYGGSDPFTLLKYSPSGGLIWTYSTTWDESSDWFGALAVDRSGNAYITNGDGATLAKINPAGGLVWSEMSGNSLTLNMEFWAMDFNCDQTQLFIGGMRGPFTTFPVGVWYGVVNQMDLTNGTISNYTEVAIVPHTGGEAINEVRSLCMSPNGNLYCLTLDTIASLTQSLTFNYRQMQDYNYDYYLPYSPGGGQGQGSNNIRATSYFLYTTNGVTLDKRDINTGNVIATTTIPGGSAQLNSGVAIDTCGNVYVGAQNQVVKFDANLNQLGTAATPGAVYDVSIGINGNVLACGNGFAAALAFNACPQVAPICYRIFTANLTPTPPHCLGQCSGSATAATTNGTGPYKYAWSNGGTTQTISNLCPGTYNVTVTDLSSNTTAVASTTVDSATAFISNVVTYAPSCGQTNGKAEAEIITGGTSPFSYSWSGGATSAVDSNLAPGQYSVTVTDAHGCSASASATLTQSSSLTLTPVSTEAACSSNNGTAYVTVTGAPGPFQYNWSNGQSTDTITGLAAGTYNVTVQDTSSANSVFWSEYFASGGNGWTLNTAGTVGPNGNSANQWIVNNDATCNCTTGNYLHITNTTNSSCLECIIMPAGTCQYLELASEFGEGDFATDVLAISPVISTVGKTNMTLGFTWESLGTPGSDYGLVDLSSDGGATWTALPMQYDNESSCTVASISIPSNYQNISNFRIAFEWINAAGSLTNEGNPPGFAIDSITLTAGSNTCPATASVTVNSSTNFTATASGNAANCSKNNGSASVTASGSSGYTYNWNTGATTDSIHNLEAGTYTVTVSASGGCSATATTTIGQTYGISLSNAATSTSCGSNNGSASVGIESGGGPFSYAWSNGGTTATINNLPAGTYYATVTGAGGCSAIDTAIINSSSGITLVSAGGTASCISNGSGSVRVVGGTGPFFYNWNNNDTTAIIDSLSAGTYTVTVTGAGGCTATATITVTASGNGVTLTSASTPSGCSDSTGSASVTATTGSSPFTYAWSNGATTASIQNAAAGSYTVTVTATGGCSASTIVNVTSSGTITVSATATAATCNSSNGSAQATTAGNGPFTYTWSNGSTTSSITNLSQGTYTVTVQEGASCSGTASAVVGTSGGTVSIQAQPAAICKGDTSQICAPAGYQSYSWNTGETSQCISATQQGNYYVTVTDPGSCTATSNHITLTVNTADTVHVATSLNGDTLEAGNAVSYQWYYNNAPISGATSADYVATQPGNYYVETTGANGCPAPSNVVVVKTVLGISEVNGGSDIKVYPNPLANGNWHLDVTSDWIGSDCEVYDAAGRLVYRAEIKSTQTEFELNVAQGVYVMRINSTQKNYAIKLIKL